MCMKKLNFSCGPARCLKLVIWPTDKKCCTSLFQMFTKQHFRCGYAYFFINILRNFTCVTDLLVFNPLGHCISFCSSFTPHIHRVTLFIVFYCWHSFSFNGFVSLNASYFTLSSSWLFLSVIWRDEGPMFNQLKRRRRFNIVERTFILFQQHI